MDKFILLERQEKLDLKNQDGNFGDASTGTLAPTYGSLESFLGDDCGPERKEEGFAEKEGFIQSTQGKEDMLPSLPGEAEHKNQVGDDTEMGDKPDIAWNSDEEQPLKDNQLASSSLPPIAKPKSSARQVAFVSVKRPAPSSTAAFVAVKRPATSDAADVKYVQTED